MYSKKKSQLWCQQEEQALGELVLIKGKKWTIISKNLKEIHNYSKSPKQCRQRWYNHLSPSISNKTWTQEEEDIIFTEHQKYGSKWKKIAQKLQGRSDNSIKNYFYSTIRKILRRVNKIIGSKKGTQKVRKIKSSTISRIFTYESNENQQTFSTDDDQIKCKQAAYHLINFLRKNPSKNKENIEREELQKFSYLLQHLIKISDKYHRKNIKEKLIKKQEIQLQQQSSQLESFRQQRECEGLFPPQQLKSCRQQIFHDDQNILQNFRQQYRNQILHTDQSIKLKNNQAISQANKKNKLENMFCFESHKNQINKKCNKNITQNSIQNTDSQKEKGQDVFKNIQMMNTLYLKHQQQEILKKGLKRNQDQSELSTQQLDFINLKMQQIKQQMKKQMQKQFCNLYERLSNINYGVIYVLPTPYDYFFNLDFNEIKQSPPKSEFE